MDQVQRTRLEEQRREVMREMQEVVMSKKFSIIWIYFCKFFLYKGNGYGGGK